MLNTARLIRQMLATMTLLALGITTSPAAGAAPAETESTSSSEKESSEANDQVDAERDKTSPGNSSSEVFIPTEEISEDFAVSFPVDI